MLLLREYLEKEWSTPMTPPIPIVIGLNVMLRIVERMGGREAWLRMYSERSEKVRRGVVELGLELFARPGYYSPTITVVKTPPGISGLEVYNAMRRRGFEIAKGYGEVRNVTFRIGHMGYVTDEDISELFANLREVLEELRGRK